MSPEDLARKIENTAALIAPKVPDISREDLHAILWNLLRPKKDPGDFLLKQVGGHQMGEVAPTLLAVVAHAITQVRLESIVIGNSAAALQGAPVTTLDIDFMFRSTKRNIEKLRRCAELLGGHLSQPFLPTSDMYRLITEDLQIDFVSRMDGIASFESLRSRAIDIDLGGCALRVASLEDVIESKQACGRDKDLASLPILKKTLAVKKALEEMGGSAL